MPPLLEEHLAAVYSGCGDDGGHGEHQVAEEPVEVHETPRSRGETFSDEGLLQTVHAAARPEEEMDDQPPNPEASQEETEHQDTQPPRNEETPENTDGGEDEVIDPLKEEVIKPAKVKLLEQFKIEMDRIRLLVKPLVDSLPLDTSQRAEVDRRIERFRSAATIVTGGSTKKPKTTELTEHLRTLLLPAVEIVVPVGVHLGKTDKERIVEVGKILDPIHKAISTSKLGIWRGFCELCGISHTQMYKYVNLFRTFGESLTEFHEFTLTELEQFKNLKDKAAQHVRDNLDELRRVRGDLEAVKKIAGKRPTSRRASKNPWVKPIQYEGCAIWVNTKTGTIKGENFFGNFDEFDKAVKRVLKKAKPVQKPTNEHGNRVDTDEDGDQEELYPAGWPSSGNTIIDDGTMDLSRSKRFAEGFTEPSFSVKGLWRNAKGEVSPFSGLKGAAEFPLTSQKAQELIETEMKERPGTVEVTVGDGTLFVMGYRVLRDGSSEIRWGIFN